MPFLTPHNFTDCRNVALLTVPPLSAALLGSLALRNENIARNYYVPDHVPRDFRLYLALNCATAAPLGYAAWMVWEYGGFRNANNRSPLVLSVSTLLTGITMAPMFKRGGFPFLTGNTCLLALYAMGTTVAYTRIEKVAGYLVLPFAAWAVYCSINALMVLNSRARVTLVMDPILALSRERNCPKRSSSTTTAVEP